MLFVMFGVPDLYSSSGRKMALPLVSLHVQMSFTWPLETQAKQH